MKRLNLPDWFWGGMAIWLAIGLPGYVLGALYKGSPIPDPPPFLQHPYEDYSLLTNALYFLILGVILLPVFLTTAFLVQRRRRQKNSDA